MASQNPFRALSSAPVDEVFRLNAQCAADPAPHKMNLTVGAYRDEQGKPYVFDVVRDVERELLTSANHEYLKITGDPEFRKLVPRLLLGAESADRIAAEGKLVCMQTLSGTGALYTAGVVIREAAEKAGEQPPAVYISDPSWGNHHKVFARAGLETRKYRYYDNATRSVDAAALTADLEAAPEGSVIVLHAVAHNPTGMDLSRDEWKAVADVCARRKLRPLFDCAYLGFASGDFVEDGWAMHHFVQHRARFPGATIIVCQSFSKNMGLYGERCGAVHVVTASKETTAALETQLALVARSTYSNPPRHGSDIVVGVLGSPQRMAAWAGEVRLCVDRMLLVRMMLYQRLCQNGCPGDWTHVVRQQGMFSFTGLTPAQVTMLREKYNIYMLNNGRISLAGANKSNIVYLADAMRDVVVADARL